MRSETEASFLAGKDQLAYRLLRHDRRCPLLLMIHGLASNLTRWSEFVELTPLRSDWDLLRLDLRGHGRSMCYCRISRQRWVDDIAQIMALEGYARGVMLGHSLGAQVALELALQQPGKVAGLILVDPVFPEALLGSLRRTMHLRPLLWCGIHALRFIHWLGIGRRQYPYRDLRALDEQTRLLLQRNTEEDIADLYMDPSSDLEYMPLVNYLQDLHAVTSPLPALQAIKVPVLVLLSAGATVTSFEVTRNRLAELPLVRTRIIDADHWLLTEKPAQAREAITDWCRSHFGQEE